MNQILNRFATLRAYRGRLQPSATLNPANTASAVGLPQKKSSRSNARAFSENRISAEPEKPNGAVQDLSELMWRTESFPRRYPIPPLQLSREGGDHARYPPSAVGPARHGREPTTRLRLRLSIMDPRRRGHKPQEDGFFHAHDGACHAGPSQRTENEAHRSVTPRKVQKADRERMRREKLNEQFLELGTALDPDRPRNDKSTILGDTVQMLKDLTSQLNKLKAEYSSLSEEERELTQEKNELRDEKALLKADVDNLNNQYQQRIQMLYPWTAMDPSVVIGPRPSFHFPVPVPIPTGAVAVHPQLQAYPFFRNQTLGAIANPCTAYMAYSQPRHPPSDQPSNQFSTPVQQSSSSQSHSPALHHASCGGRNGGFGDVATDLELKIPGSSARSHSELTNKDSSSELKEKKQCIKQINGSTHTEDSSSSRCSSIAPLDVSNSIGDGSVADDQ